MGLGLALVTLLSIAGRLNEPVTAQHGIVASANRLASEVGVEILKKGGNAVDAACAVGFALAVVYPEAGNIGGGGFMLIRLANGKSTSIDYRETAPRAGSREMYLDSSGTVVAGRSLQGYMASGVPGTVAGFAMAQRKYGRMKWGDVLKPAIDLAAKGYVLSAAAAQNLQSKNLTRFVESRRIFQKGGDFYEPGETFKQPDLTATLGRIADKGADDFYKGETAHLIAAAMRERGDITLEDLQDYRAVERKPVTGKYRGYEVIAMPPPSSGGIAVVEMLNMLQRYPLDSLGVDTVPTDHLLVEVMRRAFADRSEFMGDPDFVKIPSKGLLSKAYAEKLDGTIDPVRADSSAKIGHGQPAGHESSETTHFSVVDADGNAVSNTYTLNFGYGSGVTVNGAGFLMNDEMDDFTSKPGVPNGFGLIQGEANSISPHKRPLSSMTPTILTKDGKLFMVIGSPGGPTIITTVLQVILNVVDHGMNIADAIAAPRIHHQWLPDEIQTETGSVPGPVHDGLVADGYIFKKVGPRGGGHWGDAEGIVVDPKTGVRSGASDPRPSDAAAVGY